MQSTEQAVKDWLVHWQKPVTMRYALFLGGWRCIVNCAGFAHPWSFTSLPPTAGKISPTPNVLFQSSHGSYWWTQALCAADLAAQGPDTNGNLQHRHLRQPARLCTEQTNTPTRKVRLSLLTPGSRNRQYLPGRDGAQTVFSFHHWRCILPSTPRPIATTTRGNLSYSHEPWPGLPSQR
jgi:hypothetical protein